MSDDLVLRDGDRVKLIKGFDNCSNPADSNVPLGTVGTIVGKQASSYSGDQYFWICDDPQYHHNKDLKKRGIWYLGSDYFELTEEGPAPAPVQIKEVASHPECKVCNPPNTRPICKACNMAEVTPGTNCKYCDAFFAADSSWDRVSC